LTTAILDIVKIATVMKLLDGKHILMVLAHCDDEIICGWPIFQMSEVNKSILILSSDQYNTQRHWCVHRKFSFMDICRTYGVSGKCMDYNSDFYRLPHRDGSLKRFCDQVSLEMDAFEPYDYIFCHNPGGEYGHLDHKFTFYLVFAKAKCPILITDIYLASDWPNDEMLSPRVKRLFYHTKLGQCVLNRDIYTDIEKTYRYNGVWTWNQPPVSVCGLYKIE